MQAVILAAGKSTRTYPLTITRPKALLKIAGKNIIEHNLDALEDLVDEVILIVGFKKQMIIDYFGNQYKGIKIKYVEQKEQLGTGHALLQAKDLLQDRFIVMVADDLYHRDDLKKCLEHKYAVLSHKVTDPERYGVFVLENGLVKKIVEKPKKFVSDLANTSFYVFDKKIFDFTLPKTERGEYEVTDYVNFLSKTEDVHCETIENFWIAISYPWNVLDANEALMKKMTESDIKGDIEENVTVKGPLVLGKGSLIKSGAYLQGPIIIGENVTIGPRSFIRACTYIGDDCNINAEIKNCVIYNNTNVAHMSSYIGDSVIGEKVNLGAGTTTANLRHDNANVMSMIKDQLVDTGRRKFGTIIGDNVHTGLVTQIYPGRKIWPDKTTIPGEIVKKDIV